MSETRVPVNVRVLSGPTESAFTFIRIQSDVDLYKLNAAKEITNFRVKASTATCKEISGNTEGKKDRPGQSHRMSLNIFWWLSHRFLCQFHVILRSTESEKEWACIQSLYLYFKTGNKYVNWIQKLTVVQKTSGLAPLSLVFIQLGLEMLFQIPEAWFLLSWEVWV